MKLLKAVTRILVPILRPEKPLTQSICAAYQSCNRRAFDPYKQHGTEGMF